jgi:hypothetical protein
VADFDANLISNQALTFADVESGGTVGANFLANAAILSGGVVSVGTISANFLANAAILVGASVGTGTVASVIVTVPAVPTGPAGGGSVSSSLVFFGDSRFINRVFDAVANKFVTWPSIIPDRAGTRYPGPGVFGVTTSGYVVLSY